MRPKKAMNLERINFQLNQIVFAKQKGYVHWPGLIVDLHPTRNRCARVEFFGWNSQWAYISFNNLLHRHAAQEIISKNQNNTKFQNAITEMNIWLNGTLRSIRFEVVSDNSEKAGDGSKSSMCFKVDTHKIEIDFKTKTVTNRSDSETKAMDQKEIGPRSQHADGRKTRSNVQVINNVEHSIRRKIGEGSLNFRLTRSKSKSNDESESSKVDTHNIKNIEIDFKNKTVMSRSDSETKAMDQKEIRPRSEHADGRKTRSNVQVINNVEHSVGRKIGEGSLNFRLTRSKSKSNDESESSKFDTHNIENIKIDFKTKTVINRSDSETKPMDQKEIRPRSEHADGRRIRSNVQVKNNDCENSTLNSRVIRSKAKCNGENDFLDTDRSLKRKRLLRE